jgi:two-component system KDP operon response regulator KdpE
MMVAEFVHQISTLRQKIEAEPERPQYIFTEQGVGYRLRPAD